LIYKALWDTGATETLISNKVSSELDLDVAGTVSVSTIHGITQVKRHECCILLNNHSKSINLHPAELLK
jgi:predicted aspartyl protease